VDESKRTIVIGSVLRADIGGFVIASRIPEPEVPTFGTFVRAPIQRGQADVLGIVYDIKLQDDPFLKNLAVTVTSRDSAEYSEIIRDQQENRVLPVEISVVAVGYRQAENESVRYSYGFPPQPPMVLRRIQVCSAEEIHRITGHPDFLRVLLDNKNVPADELIPAVVQRAVMSHPSSTREDFIFECGKYIARYIGRDPVRVEKILRSIGQKVQNTSNAHQNTS
jgi:hypothetical protein